MQDGTGSVNAGLTHGVLGGYHPLVTDRDVVQMIRERVKSCGGNRAAAAASLGVSRQYLQMILSGRRIALRNRKLLKALKLRRTVIFLPM